MQIDLILEQIIFYAFSLLLIGSAFMVIVARNSVHSALFLVLAFFATAGLWILLESEFLALILIVVYVGAVMTLFLFVVMMLNLDVSPLRASFVKYTPLGILVLAFVIAAIIYVVLPNHLLLLSQVPHAPKSEAYSNITRLGLVLYTEYVYPFELAAVLLLVAIVAAISLSLRRPRAKKQNISEQLRADPKQRVQLINMPSEKKNGHSGISL